MEKIVLAIDPGSSKCGMALVRRDTAEKIHILWRAVAAREVFRQRLHDAAAVAPYSMIVVGSGTKSRDVVKEIRDELPSAGILVVDEKDTTMQARERYWEHTSRWGWRRFIPATLQVPPEPFDDYVALILAERVLLAG